jgi:negative modulator of initiation of replication
MRCPLKNIEIDDDLYAYLLKRTIRIGESASDIIRREIGNPLSRNGTQRVSHPAEAMAKTNGPTKDQSELSQFLESPMFRSQRRVVDRFLALLAWLHEHHDGRFKVALDIKGTSRTYFALTEQELLASGTSINPKRIPKSPYWVATNNETTRKQEIIRKLMQSLGYSSNAMRLAESALVPAQAGSKTPSWEEDDFV